MLIICLLLDSGVISEVEYASLVSGDGLWKRNVDEKQRAAAAAAEKAAAAAVAAEVAAAERAAAECNTEFSITFDVQLLIHLLTDSKLFR